MMPLTFISSQNILSGSMNSTRERGKKERKRSQEKNRNVSTKKKSQM